MDRTFRLWTTVLAWHDGDTYRGVVDQGFWTYRGTQTTPVRVRCALIACPELGDPGGPEAAAHARLIAPPGDYPAVSYRPPPDTYGRPLLDLVLPDGRLFSRVMLDAGHARPYKAAV